MKFFHISLLLILISLGAEAQTYRWEGKVMDQETWLPVDKTNLVLIDEIFSSNKKGEFEILFSFGTSDVVRFEVTNIAYETKIIRLHRSDFVDFVLNRDIYISSPK